MSTEVHEYKSGEYDLCCAERVALGRPDQSGDATAICLSGGGIRSAAFSIGVLKALIARRDDQSGKGQDPAEDFDYLSTVSGGGFAGAWYKAPPDKGSDVLRLGKYLDLDSKDPGLNGPLELFLVFVGKLLVYWLFAIPALAALLLFLAVVGLGIQNAVEWSSSQWHGVQAWPLVSAAPALLSLLVLVLGLRSRIGRYVLFWLAIVATACAASAYLLFHPSPIRGLEIPGMGVAFAVLVWLTSRSPAISQARWLSRVLGAARLVRLAAWIAFLFVLVLAATLLAVSLPGLAELPGFGPTVALDGSTVQPASLFLYSASIAIVCGLLPVGSISIASWYRERIRSVFNLPEAGEHLPNALERPLHLINAAAAGSASHREWDDRNATSFAWSPHGYCRHGSLPVLKEKAVDTAVAVATSAAVAGPQMGAYTAKPVGLLLSLFNVRLGQWFRLTADAPFEPGGTVGGLVWAELSGSRRKEDWIYLTDGGHFENLGLYEVIRRRCDHILVVDGGCDPKYRFSDLANAVRKVRLDFGVEIEIDGLRWTADGQSPAANMRQRVYGGSVRYPAQREKSSKPKTFPAKIGTIVYVKAAIIGDEPSDVAGYADLHPAFPHESTSDQWFSEAQFESYRRLGQYTIESAIRDYEEAKAALRGPEKKQVWDAKMIVGALREAGMTASRTELRPTHGGAILCRDRADTHPPELEFLFVEAIGGGTWVLPKGHIERGESVEDCGKRELQEEAALKLVGSGDSRRRIVVADEFVKQKDGPKIRCHYTVYYIQGKHRSEHSSGGQPGLEIEKVKIPMENRLTLWVTAAEYEVEMRRRARAKTEFDQTERPGPNQSATARRSMLQTITRQVQHRAPMETVTEDAAKLAEARTIIDDLLWLLQEATRRLERRA